MFYVVYKAHAVGKRNACRILRIIVYGAKVQKKDRQGKRRTETTIGDLPNLGCPMKGEQFGDVETLLAC
jgi:hypothetical protein